MKMTRTYSQSGDGLRKRSPYKKRPSLVGAARARTGVDCMNMSGISI